ncbi:hypothetical protein GDO81_000581 [Engystomops pustulosus]|uniref:Interleukin n=1 Tax=Engystomops pustulosus TaxID=76066 RepID=A0AAV7D9F2_ENGPU|nr:hypothetical protein GDO81_000581 [Engystomops pustulosus]KAG8592664.1 hypothetical protein GDO81_000581 [Engystomops pustulosus]KAG8592665.1 hypothetical protein GDO81_000581 [Engystomops pustulosus]KAG8592666.1 hypothetical protein GDO81_000581 [Engystomops pustulosus]KAG8592667.1 hypothetical protein GDO81_000581 [Engystomops pustulosus]
MNLCIMWIFSIILMQSFQSNYSQSQSGKIIKKELDALRKLFEGSEYWKRNYQRDLRLYTARTDDYTDACTQPVFDCYYEEFQVILQEVSMTGEENIAMQMRNTLEHIKTYRPSESDMVGSCKKCEEYEEEPYDEFVNRFESITQKMHVNGPHKKR